MTREEFLKNLQRELSRLNKEIDRKIISKESYKKESEEHRLLLKKIYQHSEKSPFGTFLTRIFSRSSLQF